MARRITEDELPIGLSEYDGSSLYYRRLIDLVAAGELSHSVVVLEFMSSLVGAFESEALEPDKVLEHLPVKKLREEAVQVPVDFLRVLIEPWQKHKHSPSAYSFSQILGIDAKGQGKQGQAAKLNRINRHIKYSNDVHVILADGKRDVPASVEQAWAEVVERYAANGQTISVDTIKKAYQENHTDFVATIDALNGR